MLRSLTRGTSGDAVAWLSVQHGPCGDPQHRCSLAGKARLSWTAGAVAGSRDGAWQTGQHIQSGQAPPDCMDIRSDITKPAKISIPNGLPGQTLFFMMRGSHACLGLVVNEPKAVEASQLSTPPKPTCSIFQSHKIYIFLMLKSYNVINAIVHCLNTNTKILFKMNSVLPGFEMLILQNIIFATLTLNRILALLF